MWFEVLFKSGIVAVCAIALIRLDLFGEHFIRGRTSWKSIAPLLVLFVVCQISTCKNLVSARLPLAMVQLGGILCLFLVFRLVAPFIALFVGELSNYAVVLANDGRMPVFWLASDYSGPNHLAASPETRLWYLADVFPLMSGDTIIGVFSIGDVLICVGFWWIFARLLTLRVQAT